MSTHESLELELSGCGATELARVAADMNVLAAFAGSRDVGKLTRDELRSHIGRPKADVMALFGGSVLAGVDVLAAAMRAGVAHTYVIVGGTGHTTEVLRSRVRACAPDLAFEDDACEADILDTFLEARHGLSADLLERTSTNCGNNIDRLLELLEHEHVACDSLILAQDLTMQRRMVARLALMAPEVTPVSFATSKVRMVVHGRELAYANEPLGMWDPAHFLTLLMGEVVRLRDDEGGYGPCGAGFIAHVDVPDEVEAAWERLHARFPWSEREANPAFAS